MRETVRGLGKKGETVLVNPGRARNALFPQGLIDHTYLGRPPPRDERMVNKDQQAAGSMSAGAALAKRLEVVSVEIKRHENPAAKGSFKGDISAENVRDALFKQHQISLPTECLKAPDGGGVIMPPAADGDDQAAAAGDDAGADAVAAAEVVEGFLEKRYGLQSVQLDPDVLGIADDEVSADALRLQVQVVKR